MKRVEKERHLENIKGVFSSHGSFILVNFQSMTAGDFIDLRKRLKAEKCGVTVVKNSIACIVLTGTEKEGLCEKLKGSVFVAYSDDIIVLAKVLAAFIKASGDKVTLIGAYDAGKILPAEKVVFFANLPSLRELQMRIMGLIGYGLPMRIASCLKAVGGK